MSAFPLHSMRRRRAAIQQAIGFLGIFAGRMEACGNHPLSSSDYADFVRELQSILDAWPVAEVEPPRAAPNQAYHIWVMWQGVKGASLHQYTFNTEIEAAMFLYGAGLGCEQQAFQTFKTQAEAMAAYARESRIDVRGVGIEPRTT